MAKSLIENIISKMTDEEGLFQGGEQGRAFGRIRDLFAGGGAHDVIDREISSGGSGSISVPKRKERDYMRQANMNALRQGFTEPSRFVEILTGMYPGIEDTWQSHGNPPLEEYEGGLGSWDYERPSGAHPRNMPFYGHDDEGEAAFQIDDIMRAILGQQYGEHTEEEPYRTKRYENGRQLNDYDHGGISRIMKVDPDATKPQVWDEFEDKMVDDFRYGDALIPQDITDIVKIIQGLDSEHDEWIDKTYFGE